MSTSTYDAGALFTAAMLNSKLQAPVAGSEISTGAINTTHISSLWPIARVGKSSTQTLSSGVFTALTFDTEDVDPLGAHSTVSNTERLTAPVPGVYFITASVGFEGSTTGTVRSARLFRNSSGMTVANSPPGAASNFLIVSDLLRLTTTDVIDVRGFHDATGSLGCSSASYLGFVWKAP